MISKRPSAIPFSEFEQNRQKFTLAELLPYQDKWVAFSGDGARILAWGDDLIEVARALTAAGHDPAKAPLEYIYIDLENTIYLGGAELL